MDKQQCFSAYDLWHQRLHLYYFSLRSFWHLNLVLILAKSQLISKKRLLVPTALHLISMQEDMPAPGERCGCSEWLLTHMVHQDPEECHGTHPKHSPGSSKIQVPLLGSLGSGSLISSGVSQEEELRFPSPWFPKEGQASQGHRYLSPELYILASGPELPLRGLYRCWPASVRHILHTHPSKMLLKEQC